MLSITVGEKVKCPECQAPNPDTQKFCGECGTNLPEFKGVAGSFTKTLEIPVEALTTGSTLAGRYQIIEELGHGGMGRVYRAHDTQLHEEVALKLIKPEIGLDKKTLDRFKTELKLARKISHRNVGRMYELMEFQGLHFITMEYVAGGDLKSFLRRSGQLTIPKAVSVAKNVCQGLAEAHRMGVIHRDLKPHNIMIDKSGDARILDFGIARSLKAKDITGPGVMIGTPEYMSPEQVEGKDADQRSDLYSLGVVLYEMVTGQLPFDGETPLAIAVKQTHQLPADPSTLNPQVPKELSRLILKCLAKNKTERYQEAEEVCTELTRVEKGLPTTEKVISQRKPLTSKEISVRFSLKKILIPALVLFVMVSIVVFLLLTGSNKSLVSASKIENSIAVISFENQSGDPALDYLTKAIPNLLITKLEQQSDIYVVTWERLSDVLKQMGRDDVESIGRELGFELCQREGIQAIVLGSFVKAGDVFATDVKVLDVDTKKSIRSAGTRGDGIASILQTQIDELSRQIIQGIGFTPQKSGSPETLIADITTSSMEAYELFIKGREELDRFLSGNARYFLEQALAIDPEFASAYLYLGRAQTDLENLNARDEAYKKAKQFAAAASEKERLYIEAEYAGTIERDSQKRLQAYQKLVEKFPQEKRALYYIGNIYASRDMYENAVIAFQDALDLDPGYGIVLNALAYVYSDLGANEKAVEYFQKYVDAAPGDPNPLDSLAEQYFRMGRLDEAIRKYQEVVDMEPSYASSRSISYIYALKEDYASALQWIARYAGSAPSPGLKAVAYAWQSIYFALLGRRDEAFQSLDLADSLTQQDGNPLRIATMFFIRGWIYYDLADYDTSLILIKKLSEYLLSASPESVLFEIADCVYRGFIEARTGEIESASASMKKISPLLAKLSPASQAAFTVRRNWVLSEIYVRQGRPGTGVALLLETPHLPIPTMAFDDITPYNLPIQKDFLARAYIANGEIDKAILEYEKLITFDAEREQRYLIHPRYHLSLAKLYEEKRLFEKSAAQHEIFLDLWKNADPGLPELEEARSRLSALK